MTTLQTRQATQAGARSAGTEQARHGYHVEVLLVSFAALLIEVSYTRVISFKLFYYYTYLIIGLALLGIGTGGVMVAVSDRLRRARTDAIVVWSLLLGALSVAVSYVVVAFISLNTLAIWRYGTWASAKSVGFLLAICLLVFLPFVAPGVVLATLFGRRPDKVGGLYFADLVGAGAACGVVIYLAASIGPPATIMLGALVLVVGAVRATRRIWPAALPALGVLAVLAAVVVAAPNLLPAQRLDTTKAVLFPRAPVYSSWSPIFRVDAVQLGPDVRMLYHDGLVGSAIYRWDGKVSSLAHYDFGADPRWFPFAVTGGPPRREAVIGAAGGHEVLASLYFGAGHIDAVELNPVTYSLVTTTFARFDGHLAQDPAVNYINGDGRSFMARSHGTYDLIWYPAPDSYAATNAATASAFVLSESYLYTTNALFDSFKHLTPNGVFVAQFGEVDYQHKPYRTTRFVATARRALAELGVLDPSDHILVATTATNFLGSFTLSTIVVKPAAFTPLDLARFVLAVRQVPGSALQYAPGDRYPPNPAATAASSSEAGFRSFLSSYRYNVTPTTDNDPFFWHVARFSTVLSDYSHPITTADREDQVGERVLVLLLGISIVVSALFLLLPFVAIRDVWRRMPRKGRSAVFFASLGFGFMFFEITLMQLLNLFLGYPTYALTVTLMSILVFTGIGALLSAKQRDRPRAVPLLVITITGLSLFYLFGLTPMTSALLGLPLSARVPIAFAVLAPLGLCLGMFMPLGLEAVSKLGDAPRQYVAWGWAVNGFASVVGAALATVLAMMFGFHFVLFLGLVAYLMALLAWRTLTTRRVPGASSR